MSDVDATGVHLPEDGSEWTPLEMTLRWRNERYRFFAAVRDQLVAEESFVAATGAYHPAVPGGVSVTAGGGPLTTTIWFRPAEDRDGEWEYCIAGPAEQAHHERDQWARLLRTAYDRLRNEPVPARQWVAVIGPCPRQGAAVELAQAYPQRLPEPVGSDTDPVRLLSVDQWTIEDHRYPDDSTAWYPLAYWPVEVRGTVEAHETPTARDRAAWTLHRTCVLLSLACDWRWTLRHAPTIGEEADLTEVVVSWRRHARDQSHPHLREQVPPPQYFELPQWVIRALAQLDASTRIPRGTQAPAVLDKALDAYGAGLEDFCELRTSSAAERFVAALEALGRKGRSQAGDSARHAVATFLAEGEPTVQDRALAKRIVMYDRRSSTAHAATLHGNELRLGLPTAISGDERHDYNLRVGLLRRVCRALLIRELGGLAEDPAAIREHLHAIDTSLVLPGPM